MRQRLTYEKKWGREKRDGQKKEKKFKRKKNKGEKAEGREKIDR